MIDEKELQTNHTICLELLDLFLEVCEKHNIEYYLAFGSCLGAVRHHGFIPWDINIDVLVTVDEYRKLNDAFLAEDLGDCEWCIPENSARMYPLLRKKGSWSICSTKPNLDVSVYGKAPDNSFLRWMVIKSAYFNRKMYKLKNTDVKRAFPFNILKAFSSAIPNSAYMGVMHRLESLNHNKDKEYLFVILPSVWEDRETIKKEWMDEGPVIAEFEGRKVRILSGYDKYLTLRYGDYMTPVVWDDKGQYKHAITPKNK